MPAAASRSQLGVVAAVSLAAWVFLGVAYGDDLLWTIVRAVLGTTTIFGLAMLNASRSPVARVSVVVIGTLLGAFCAASLGATTAATIAVATGFALVLLIADRAKTV